MAFNRMSSYRAVAAKVAEAKRLHPEQFCPVSRCLWRTGGGRCPRHHVPEAVPVAVEEPETTPIPVERMAAVVAGRRS